MSKKRYCQWFLDQKTFSPQLTGGGKSLIQPHMSWAVSTYNVIAAINVPTSPIISDCDLYVLKSSSGDNRLKAIRYRLSQLEGKTRAFLFSSSIKPLSPPPCYHAYQHPCLATNQYACLAKKTHPHIEIYKIRVLKRDHHFNKVSQNTQFGKKTADNKISFISLSCCIINTNLIAPYRGLYHSTYDIGHPSRA